MSVTKRMVDVRASASTMMEATSVDVPLASLSERTSMNVKASSIQIKRKKLYYLFLYNEKNI